MRRGLFFAAALSLAIGVRPVAAQGDKLVVRVVDVGAGLACIVATPDNHYMIYDTGHWAAAAQNAVVAAAEEIIPEGAEVDLLVLSHVDSDHHGATPELCDLYKIKRVIRDGLRGTTQTWKASDRAIRNEVRDEDCEDLNLRNVEINPGDTFPVGEATATFICGFYELPDGWEAELEDSEARNARSVVIRLECNGKSILFCGDTVGRHTGDDSDVCLAAERFMVDNAHEVPIDSDVIIAPHHGADNGSSSAFIEAVSPLFVVFSAGHSYRHPRQATAERYLAAGVQLERMFRTDWGDNERRDEWRHGGGSRPDPVGDDDVDITVASSGRIRVGPVSRTPPFLVGGPNPGAEALAEGEPGILSLDVPAAGSRTLRLEEPGYSAAMDLGSTGGIGRTEASAGEDARCRPTYQPSRRRWLRWKGR